MKINNISMAIIAAASLLAVSPAANAQAPQTNNAGGAAAPARPRGGGMTVESIDKAVTLTDAQKPKVKTAVDELNSAVQEARNADQSERRTKMTAARDDFNKKMKDILTPEQYTKFEAMPRPGRRGQGGGGAGGGGGTPPPAN
jgi:Spy/CpxP family protein refolding chaperone